MKQDLLERYGGRKLRIPWLSFGFILLQKENVENIEVGMCLEHSMNRTKLVWPVNQKRDRR
jgi:hypothetical protein